MSDIDIVIEAAERAKRRLELFAVGNDILPESYGAVVQDIGAFGVFIEELRTLIAREAASG